ncbi:MAG: cohesin domain-containing protein [Patescibacteria group bacterium]
MKKLAVLAFGMMTFGLLAPVAHASGQAIMSLSPTSVSAVVGDTFSLTVSVDPNGETLDTARADISFTSSNLEVLDVTLGSLFPAASPGNSTSNTDGTLSYGGYKFGGDVTESGTFLTITLHALAGGTATVSVTDDSRLISSGDEKIDLTQLGSATITITGTGTAVSEAEEEDEVDTDASLEQQALVYFGAFAGRMPSSGTDWSALHCIAYDTCNPSASGRVVSREATSLEVFGAKYAKLPSSTMDWNTIHALAYTEVFYDWDGDGLTGADETDSAVVEEEEVVVEEEEVVEEASLEAQALVYFGAFAGKMPSSSVDWTALHCIAYDDCYPSDSADRRVDREETSLEVFGAKYAKLPSSTMDWNTIHALAYTEVFYDWSEIDAEAVVEEEVVAEEVVASDDAESTSQDEAIGYFGQLTGYLPSTSADWLAVEYMVDGYTPSGDERDVDAESSAIAKFGEVFGSLPSSSADWNIVAAIAYSGAIL